MHKYILSVCIPTYDREETLIFSIKTLLQSAARIEGNEKIELVISDNSKSSRLDMIESLIREDSSDNLVLNYKWNEGNNIGVDDNVLQAVSIASGLYCWIIGDDDFVFPNSIPRIIRLIESRSNVDIIFLNRINYNLDTPKNSSVKYEEINNLFNRHGSINLSLGDIIEGNIWDFVSSNNVYMGAMMLMVFKKEKWDSFFPIKSEILRESNYAVEVFYMYAQTIILGYKSSGLLCCQIPEPNIIVGDGVRNWSTGKYFNNIWKSKELRIHTTILPNLILFYKENGMPSKIARSYLSHLSFFAGFYLLPYVFHSIISHDKKSKSEKVDVIKSFCLNFRYFRFYYGMIRGIVSVFILNPIRRRIHHA